MTKRRYEIKQLIKQLYGMENDVQITIEEFNTIDNIFEEIYQKNNTNTNINNTNTNTDNTDTNTDNTNIDNTNTDTDTDTNIDNTDTNTDNTNIDNTNTDTNINNANKKKKHLSKEHREKISKSSKGKKMSAEAKQRMRRNSHHINVAQIDVEGNIINVFESTREVQRLKGYNNSSISKCCRGKQNTSHGYFWCYVSNKDVDVQISIKAEFKNH